MGEVGGGRWEVRWVNGTGSWDGELGRGEEGEGRECMGVCGKWGGIEVGVCVKWGG